MKTKAFSAPKRTADMFVPSSLAPAPAPSLDQPPARETTATSLPPNTVTVMAELARSNAELARTNAALTRSNAELTRTNAGLARELRLLRESLGVEDDEEPTLIDRAIAEREASESENRAMEEILNRGSPSSIGSPSRRLERDELEWIGRAVTHAKSRPL
jgi:hypothetical protein